MSRGPFVIIAPTGSRASALIVATKLVVGRNLSRREDPGGPQVRRQVNRHQFALEPADVGDESRQVLLRDGRRPKSFLQRLPGGKVTFPGGDGVGQVMIEDLLNLRLLVGRKIELLRQFEHVPGSGNAVEFGRQCQTGALALPDLLDQIGTQGTDRRVRIVDTGVGRGVRRLRGGGLAGVAPTTVIIGWGSILGAGYPRSMPDHRQQDEHAGRERGPDRESYDGH